MNRHEMDWDQLGTVWRTAAIDKDALVVQLQVRLKRQTLFRRLEKAAEIFTILLTVWVGGIFWLNLRGEGLARQITFEVLLLLFVGGCLAASWWTKRGTNGQAQTLAAMIDLTIARAQSSRRRVTAFTLTAALAFAWGLGAWFLMLPNGVPEEEARQRALLSLIFIILWSSLWGAATIAWAWWSWRRDQKILAQYREIKRILEENGED
jgi:hypothetical protein